MTNTDTEPLAPWEIELLNVAPIRRSDTVSGYSHRTILRRALRYLDAWRERERAYAEEVESYHRQGLRAHYCIHGTDRWVDWDNICGGCEDPTDPREHALNLAWRDYRDMVKRAEITVPFMAADPPVAEIASAIWAWVNDPMSGDLR